MQLIISAPDEYIYERISCVLFILATVVTPATNMEVDPTQIPLPEDNPPQPHQQDIKLPPFWTTRPRAWFTFVESDSGYVASKTTSPGSTTSSQPSLRR